MNTLLINECNKLRKEKLKLQEYLGVQKKSLKEILREIGNKSDIEELD